jgi:putative flippase GtrA
MQKLHRELITFLIVGSLNTLFSYSLFCLFIYLGLNHLIAITLSFCCGVMLSFQTIGRFVFKSHDRERMIKFIILYISLYLFNLVFLDSLKYISHNWYLNGLITTIIGAGLSFIFNKIWVFKIKGHNHVSS